MLPPKTGQISKTLTPIQRRLQTGVQKVLETVPLNPLRQAKPEKVHKEKRKYKKMRFLTIFEIFKIIYFEILM